MNCHACQKRIRTPRNEYTVAELIEMLRPKCIACDPTQMPRGGRSQVELTDFTASKRKVDPCDQVPISQNQADRDVCGVSPDAFDRLRTAMTALFALNPLDLIIVQHIANGGKYSDIEQVYINLMQKCKRYHGSARQMIYARKNNICAKLPQLKPMIDAVVRRGGKDADVRREVDD